MTTSTITDVGVQVLEAVCRHLWQRDPQALVEVLSAAVVGEQAQVPSRMALTAPGLIPT